MRQQALPDDSVVEQFDKPQDSHSLIARALYPSATLATVLLVVGLLLAQRPQPSAALPTFAQAYQVDCSACHTMVPALNAYGRYVQSTAFNALDAKILQRAVPLVVREEISYGSTGNLNSHQLASKFTELNASVNLVGVLNKSLSYRLEQSLYDNNLGGGDTGHLWVAYNQLFHGDAHVIVGKFDAPAPPAFSFWHDQSVFSSPEITVGQHGYLLDGLRWGLGFNYVPQNYIKQPYKIQLAYLGNSPSLYNSTVFSNSNPYATNASGSDRAFQYKIAYARPDEPLEAGVYGAIGSYVLADGYVHPADDYKSVGVYAQRDPVKNVPGVLVFYQQTYDGNVGPGVPSDGLEQSARSRAFALEVDESLFRGDVLIGIRPVEYLSGLQASTGGIDTTRTAQPHFGVFNIIARDPKVSPYLYFVFESGVSGASDATNGQPAWRGGLKFAGPLFRARRLAAVPTAQTAPAPATGTASPIGRDTVSQVITPSMAPSTGTASPSSSVTASARNTPSMAPSQQVLQAGQKVYATNCAACHGANGTGGVGPSLHQVATTKTLAQTVAFIKNPSGAMPKLYPATLSKTQVDEVAAYIRATFH